MMMMKIYKSVRVELDENWRCWKVRIESLERGCRA